MDAKCEHESTCNICTVNFAKSEPFSQTQHEGHVYERTRTMKIVLAIVCFLTLKHNKVVSGFGSRGPSMNYSLQYKFKRVYKCFSKDES